MCPECGHVFRGKGWDGIDAHWRAHHEGILSYEAFWTGLCDGHRGRDRPSRSEATIAAADLGMRLEAVLKAMVAEGLVTPSGSGVWVPGIQNGAMGHLLRQMGEAGFLTDRARAHLGLPSARTDPAS